jgi:hypothetical protein
LGVSLGFRPIREDPVGRSSLLAPSSPTRVDGGSHPAWNVTGRGGGRADYRRRTVEYVDNNANNPAHHSHIPVDFNKHGNFILPTLENVYNFYSSHFYIDCKLSV